jgi:hypothetical protein
MEPAHRCVDATAAASSIRSSPATAESPKCRRRRTGVSEMAPTEAGGAKPRRRGTMLPPRGAAQCLAQLADAQLALWREAYVPAADAGQQTEFGRDRPRTVLRLGQ